MAEVISTTGTAVGIVSLGLQVCSSIVNYYNQWKDFDSDIKGTRDMVLHLRNTLKVLQPKLQTDVLAHKASAVQVETIVQSCEESICKLQKRIEKIELTKIPPLQPTKLPVTKSEKMKKKLSISASQLQHQGERFFYPFQQGTLGKLRDAVAELRAQLEPALQLLNLDIATDIASELRISRAQQSAWLAGKEAKRVLSWLSPLEFASRQRAILTKRHPGTVEWFLKSPAFIAWSEADANVPPGLWCQGQMGAGKSVLAATVIEHLQLISTPGETAIIYTYCDWQDSMAQDLCSLLGSLIRQCIEYCPSIPLVIQERFEKHKSGKLPLIVSDIPSIIQDIRSIFNRLYIVVDGLDECGYEDENKGGTSRMAELEGALDLWLSSQPDPQSHKTRLLITSRFNPREASKTKFAEVEIKAIKDDLEKVVASALMTRDWTLPWASVELGLLVQNDHDMREQIIRTCVDCADGMFLIPQLYVAHLKSMLNRRQLRNAIKEGPRSLGHSIDACFQRIDRQSPAMKCLAQEIIMWLCYSLRPIRVCELQHALSVELEDEDFIEDGLSPVNVLIISCAGLVTIDYDFEIIRFVNFSIKEYLSKDSSGFICPLESNQKITKTCATYLSFRCFDIDANLLPESYPPEASSSSITQEMVDTWLVRYPFLRYAARYWAEHMVLSPESSVATLACKLLLCDRKASFLYIVFYATLFQSIASSPSFVSGLHLAVFFGLVRTTSLLLETTKSQKPASIKVGDSFGRTPLWLAAARGHASIVEELLKSGADVSGRHNYRGQWENSEKWWLPAWGRDDFSAEALEVAVEGGHLEIVTQLLKAGASFGRSTGVHGGPLEAAVFKGYTKIAEVILAAGAPIKRTAIQASVYGGNQDILHMLIKKFSETEEMINKQPQRWIPDTLSGTDFLMYGDIRSTLAPTSKDDTLQMAAYAAALANRLEIMEMLFDNGVEVNAITDGFHGTVLAAASAHGHVEMVRFLIEVGADLNQILSEHEFPSKSQQKAPKSLKIKSQNEKPNPIGILRSYEQKSFRKPSGRHGTALQAAAFAESVVVIRLLLDHGAHVNAPAGHFGTALQCASICGNIEIVDLLLDRGASPNLSGGLYGNPLQAAAFNGHPSVLQRLIKAGSDINLKGGYFGYSVVAAAASHNLKCLQILIDAGAGINSTSENAGCALRAASRRTLREANRLKTPDLRRRPWAHKEIPMLDVGATTKLDDFVKFAENPRSLALCQGQWVFGHYAGRAAQEIFLPTDSAIFEQVESTCSKKDDSLACVRLLLKHGADPNMVDSHFGSPLVAAVRNKDLPVTQELVNGGADISTSPILEEVSGTSGARHPSDYDREFIGNSGAFHPSDYGGEFVGTPPTALSTAIMNDDAQIVRYLLDQGADANEEGVPGGRTLLHICRSSTVMAFLISHGAAVNTPNRWGSTALHHVAQYGSPDMVKMVIEAGADISRCNESGSTALHEAMHSVRHRMNDNYLETITETLLSAGVDRGAHDRRGRTALDLCNSDSGKVLRLLLSSSVDVSMQNSALKKVLLWKRYDRTVPDLELAQWLVDQGASLNAGSLADLSAEQANFVAACEKRDAAISTPSEQKLEPTSSDDSFLHYRSYQRITWVTQPYRQEQENWNILICLASDGPDDIERLQFLIRNEIDLGKYGSTALLLAVRNQNRNLAHCLLDHGVPVDETAIRITLWGRMTGGGIVLYALDDEFLDNEIQANECWNGIYKRVRALKEKAAMIEEHSY
ncbi:MAG: hypothetical protein Q9160_008813 [Pyrenula sp. 1 TL-2023]